MREQYKQALKVLFQHEVLDARKELKISQEEMARRLAMDSRTYVDLEHGKFSCSAVTLAIYLVYVCKDADVFLAELRQAFEEESENIVQSAALCVYQM